MISFKGVHFPKDIILYAVFSMSVTYRQSYPHYARDDTKQRKTTMPFMQLSPIAPYELRLTGLLFGFNSISTYWMKMH